MKNIIKNFSQFVNESGLGYGWASRKELRKELVGGKGQKREYDALSEPDRIDLEGLFASINLCGEEKAKPMVSAFVGSLSKYNTLEEIKAALELAREELYNPSEDSEEPRWNSRNSSIGGEESGKSNGGYYYDQAEE